VRFADRTVVVTGASRGLGRHLAIAFAREGAFVGIGYRVRGEDAESTLALCREAGGDGALLAFDVADRAAVNDALARFGENRGGIDVLVNNAGINRDDFFAIGAPTDWDTVVDVNLTGTYNCSRAVVGGMLARRRGSIVNVASVAALRSSIGQTAYASSKAGVIGFSRALARELAGKGVRVNAVVPGFIDSGMAARLDWSRKKQATDAIPIGRFGTPEDVAAAVLFLASDDARYVLGHALVVDGGLSL